MTEPLLHLNHVCKQFSVKGGEAVQALRDVSFQVEKGEYLCFLGRSGCGKSTLLSIIAGLIDSTSGTVTWKGKPVIGPSRHRMLMFQDAALFPWLDAFHNVLYSLKFVPNLTTGERKERAAHYLDLVGLTPYKNFRIHQLSGGMRQRVALARALAPDPDILMMDEPFSALDAMTREQLYADMQNIWRETGKTILMVTHNVREVACVGNRVITMESEGRIRADEAITLPYPRNMNDVELAKTAARISTLLPS